MPKKKASLTSDLDTIRKSSPYKTARSLILLLFCLAGGIFVL
jgi:hypothetical protein